MTLPVFSKFKLLHFQWLFDNHQDQKILNLLHKNNNIKEIEHLLDKEQDYFLNRAIRGKRWSLAAELSKTAGNPESTLKTWMTAYKEAAKAGKN